LKTDAILKHIATALDLYKVATQSISIRARVGAIETPHINGIERSSHCMEVQEYMDGVMSCPDGQFIVDIQHAVNHRDVTCASPFVPGYLVQGSCLPHYIRNYIYWRAIGRSQYRFKALLPCFDEVDNCFGHVKNFVVIYTCGTVAKEASQRNFRWLDGTNDGIAMNFDSLEPNNWNYASSRVQTITEVAKSSDCNTFRDDPVAYMHLKGEDCLELTVRNKDTYGYNDIPCHENYPLPYEEDGMLTDPSCPGVLSLLLE
jgi:hypothetical protein